MKLKDWRHANELTMSQAAQRLGVSQATISRLEGGKQRPDWPTMEAIAAITNGAVTPNDFGNVELVSPEATS